MGERQGVFIAWERHYQHSNQEIRGFSRFFPTFYFDSAEAEDPEMTYFSQGTPRSLLGFLRYY